MMFVKYTNMISARTTNLRTELRAARALYICGMGGETTVQLAGDHRHAATVTAKRYHGNWEAVDAPDLTTVVVSPCGIKWFPEAERGMKIHEGMCKSCRRIRTNNGTEMPTPTPTPVAVEAVPPAEHTNGTFDAAIGRLHTLSSSALDLAGHCDEAARALESLADYDSQMTTLRDSYQAALATASGVLRVATVS